MTGRWFRRGELPATSPYAAPCPYCGAHRRLPCIVRSTGHPHHTAHSVRKELATGDIDWPARTSAQAPSPRPGRAQRAGAPTRGARAHVTRAEDQHTEATAPW
jgi:hypothetical protein